MWPRAIPDPPLPNLEGTDQEIVEAVHEAREAVLRQRSSASTWGHLGEVLLAHEFNREANRCLRQAELLDPREPAWPYLQGYNLALHDPDAGILCLQRAAELCDRDQPAPRLFLAEVLLERGRLEEGQAHLNQVLQTHPNNLRARLALGRIALLRQEWREGLALLESCRSDVHTRKRAHTLRAEAWGQLGEMTRAGVERSEATALPPDRPWPDPFHEKVLRLRRGLRARFQSVNYLLQAGRAREAVDLLHETLDRYPKSLEGWMRLGEVWTQAKQLDKARECFRQATQLAPDLAEAWFRLGCVEAFAHRREAVSSFREAIRLKPEYAQAHYNLGQCLKEQGDLDAASEEFREALRCRPDYAPARIALEALRAPRKSPP
jgi:tetratricopeptide (TPR) repeat protein